jgi:AraC family transcriptional activator of pobA
MPSPIPTYDLYGEGPIRRPDFWLHCETIASRSSGYHWEIGLHRHESFQQFLYLRNGSGDAVFSTGHVPLAPPCVVSIPPGLSHGFRFSPDVDGVVVTLLAERLRLRAGRAVISRDDWLSSPRVIPLFPSDDTRYLDDTLARLLREFERQRSGSHELVEAYMKIVVLILSRQIGGKEKPALGDGKHARLDALNDLIDRHFRRRLPASAYAAMLNLSSTHLNRLAREVADMTVHDLIMARIVEEARRALVFTPTSIQGIADQLGFADAAYFGRCFRNRTGQAPGRYRREERRKLADIEKAEEAELTA